MTAPPDIIGHRITRLLQTPPEPAGVWVKEFGEAFCISLVAELDDGRLLHAGEFGCEAFDGPAESLIAAELVQEHCRIEDVQGQEIVGLTDTAGEFAVALKNGLFLTCESGPGGNYPLIYRDEDIEPVTDWAATVPTVRPASKPTTGGEAARNGRIDRLAVTLAVVAFASVLVSAMFEPRRFKPMPPDGDDTMLLIFLACAAVGMIPMAVAMPRVRVGLTSMSNVPSDTYLMPRFLVRWLIGMSLGQFAGCVVLTIAVDRGFAWFAGLVGIFSTAFCASAWGRLKKHPRTEWQVPWWRWWPWR